VLTGYNHFVYANNILGKIIPAGMDSLPDSSFYLYGKPAFWDDGEPWPDIGWPNQPGSGLVPAKKRWEEGGLLTVCPQVPTAVEDLFAGQGTWRIWPNPVKGALHILAGGQSLPDGFRVRIFDLQGKQLLIKEYPGKSAVVPLPVAMHNGIYLLKIRSKKSLFTKKIVLIR